MPKADAPHTQPSRAIFATRLGAIATTVGSAVGLGNIWRFPFEAGTHGGGAFLLCYIFFIFVLGIPVLCAEFAMGRNTRRGIFGAFSRLSSRPYWRLTGYIGIAASLMILSFYSVVAGWTVEYIWQSASGGLAQTSVEGLHQQFGDFCTNAWRPTVCTLVFLAINFLVVSRGVTKGIEKISNILMPLLFLLLIGFCINSLRLPKATEGLRFLFSPDFTQLTPSVILGAMGQAFFSLSLGIGVLMTYASYFNAGTAIARTAAMTAALDTCVAVLAGIIIFPAVFSFGMEPTAGPTLVFEVLPSIFAQMPGGTGLAIFFFVLLFVASLTSTISMSEAPIAFFIEERRMSRPAAIATTAAIAVVFGTLCALSFGPLAHWQLSGKTLFELFDYLSSNILLPMGGMLISIFVGWRMPRALFAHEMRPASRRAVSALAFCLRYVAPTLIFLVFLNSIGAI